MLPVDVARNPVNGELASAWVRVETRAAAPGEAARWDMHQAFELVAVLAGRHERHYRGLVRELGPGELAFSGAWEPHGWRTLQPGTVLLVVFFLPEFLGDERLGESSWLSLFVAPPHLRPTVVSDTQRRRVLRIAQDLREEAEARPQGWLTALRLGLLQLLFTVARGWRPPGAGGRQPEARLSDLTRVAPALDLVASRPWRRPTLAEAAAACSLSPSRFAVVFRHTMGVSFGRFVLRSRMGHAARAVLTSDASIQSIAREFGFADASHFHHAFTKCYGVTPARYRGQLKRLAAGWEMEVTGGL